MKKLTSAAVLLVLAACNDELPPQVADMIETYSKDYGQAPDEVWQYELKGQTVYYVPPMPYDIPSTLFSAEGEFLCSPDGGLTGKGDGKCPDFFEQRGDGEVIWHKE